MKFKKFFLVPVMTGLLAMMTLAGCGGKSESVSSSEAANNMYTHVSASAIGFVKINAQTLLDNAGIKVDGDRLILPPSLRYLIYDPEAEKIISRFAGCLDLNNMLGVLKAQNTGFITFPTRDSDRLRKILSGMADEDRAEGFYVYHLEFDKIVMVRDEQVWYTNSLYDVINDYAEASTNSIAASKNLSEKLNAGTISAIVDVKAFDKIYDDFVNENLYYGYDDINYKKYANFTIPGDYAGLMFDLTGAKLAGSFDIYDRDFNKLSLGVSEIFDGKITGSDFAALQGDANMVFAIAKPKQEILQTILDLAGIDGFNRVIVEEVLSGINGPIAVGVTFPTTERGLENPAAWKVTAAVSFDEETANNLLSLLPMFGGQEYGDGYKYNIDIDRYRSLPIYIGYKNGQIVASTSPLTANGGNTEANALVGTVLGLYVNFPAGALLKSAIGVDFGVVGDLKVTNEGVDGSVQLTNTGNTLIGTLLNQYYK